MLKIFQPDLTEIREKPTDRFIGKEFDWLTIEEELLKINGHRMWLCRCTCGKTRKVRQSDLLRHQTRSCGKCIFYPNSHPKARKS